MAKCQHDALIRSQWPFSKKQKKCKYSEPIKENIEDKAKNILESLQPKFG